MAMVDVDITLLQLSPPASGGAAELLRLSDVCIAAGFNAKISTNPVELSTARSPRRTTVVVIEGLADSEYDPYALMSILRCLRRLRIVMLVPDNSTARSRALSCGADLCVSYPVDADEFLSAVHAVARRCAFFRGPCDDNDNSMTCSARNDDPRLDPSSPAVLAIDGCRLDNGTAPATWLLMARGWSLRSPEGANITLTATERTLMLRLFAAQPSVVSHEELQTQYGYTGVSTTNPLAVAISRLKKKCKADGIQLPINCSRGRGYRFDASCEIQSP